ncbi:hypothetical protein RB195_013010 [Necator americanus]|uniref:ShKT domain-containing protein n=1 Tax=Necator americanus TaxID=51031 RepID=A0ABR1DTL1_NECAM
MVVPEHIRAHPVRSSAGVRVESTHTFCSSTTTGTTLTAVSNLVPVVTFNRYGKSTIGLSYRYVDSNQPDAVEPPVQITTKKPSVVQTTTRPVTKCVNNFYDCTILAFFGFCGYPQVRQQCMRACGLC